MHSLDELLVPSDRSVTVSLALADRSLPLVVRPAGPRADLEAWLREHRDTTDRWLAQHGAVLFRGFGVGSPQEFERAMRSATGDSWVDYREAATPRSHVTGHVFTATDFDRRHRLYVHNENSHVTTWPLRISFYCLTPPEQGGETPIADCRRVFARIDRSIRDELIAAGWLYVRTFGYGLGLPWERVFGTDTREGVADYCARNFMVHEWREDGGLAVYYRRWAALRHPVTGEDTWFNHGTFYNALTLEPAQRRFLLEFGEDRIPYNTYRGDGRRIAPETMRALQSAYESETVRVPWERGDVMMVDNMLVAHGRESFQGTREVFVAMAQRISCEQVARREDYELPSAAGISRLRQEQQGQ